MKIITHQCDVCKGANAAHVGKEIQVIFTTETTEGHSVTPYLAAVEIDMCEGVYEDPDDRQVLVGQQDESVQGGSMENKTRQLGLFDTAAQCRAEALEKIDVERLRGLVEAEYMQIPAGATADEIVARLQKRGIKVDELAIRPRVTELKGKGRLHPTTERRKNKKGNTCAVLRHVNFRGADDAH